jgi:hypothetical protein
VDLNDREAIRQTLTRELGWTDAPARDMLKHRFSFFALENHPFGDVIRWNRDYRSGVEAPKEFGPLQDYRDSARCGDIKYVWEHNRHHHLVEMSKAWYLTGDEAFADDVVGQVRSWIDQCPYPFGLQWSSALESAIRVINWTFALRFLTAAGTPRRLTPEALQEWVHALHEHLWFIDRNLSAHSSANNHLIGEAAGLFIGSLMVDLPCSKRWTRRAASILEREALAQVWPDGVTREQTTAYQTFVFDFLFIAMRLGELNGISFSVAYRERLERMGEFVGALIDGNGDVPAIGDDDEGYVVVLSHAPGFRKYRSLLDSAAIEFGRPDFRSWEGRADEKTFWLTGQAQPAPAAGGSRPPAEDFPDGGYHILRGAESIVIFDCGPLGYLSIAAHGHADALSVLLNYRGMPFLVDPGTYVYHSDRVWRDYFRGTRAHNTVLVDGLDQSVIGGSFLWLRHAQATLLERGPGRVRGRHDGYARLDDPLIHEREVRLDVQNRVVIVTDRIDCRQEHAIDVLWHIHPDCLSAADGGRITVTHGGAAIAIEPEAGQVSLHRGETDPPLGWYSPGVDRKTPSTAVRWSRTIAGSASWSTRIHLL